MSTRRRFATRQHPAPIEPDTFDEGETLVTNLQFRLNGVIITQLKVRPVAIDGTTDAWELVACHTLGEFAIDDNDGLAPALTRFILEVRDATIPPIERRYLPNKGWKRMTTRECLALLESAGVIDGAYGTSL
jgi:hypothetical protein